MQKSTEERLADIESGITRLTKMQGCVLEVLLVMQKTSMLLRRTERALTSVEGSLEPAERDMDRFLVLFFGSMTMLAIAISLSVVNSATPNFSARVLSIVFSILALAFFIIGFFEYRRASGRVREAKKKLTQTDEVLESAEEEATALGDDLAQVSAEWKKLVPDDLATKSGNDTPGPKDSHDRS
jgi:uncharacterized membrane-anchored protein